MHELVSTDEPISLNKKKLSCQYRLIPVDIQARKHMDNAGDSICQIFFFFLFFCIRTKRKTSIATLTTGTKQDESVYNYAYSNIQRYKLAATIKCK